MIYYMLVLVSNPKPMDTTLTRYFFLFLGILVLNNCTQKGNSNPPAEPQKAASLQPWTENPAYWQYKEEAVLLLGATDNDNLFQSADLIHQLDLLAENGGNYIRNTMSSRDSADVWPFGRGAHGIYDLDKWNAEYWNRFENLLKAAEERDIIVQIEVWDRFDFSREPWNLNPFNPKNNGNYDSLIGLSHTYPKHPSSDLQPFFHTIPGMPRFAPTLDILREYQEKYVDKLLAYTLSYGNVLYCMNNETTTPKEWGLYWMNYISDKAKTAGQKVYVTDMFDSYHKPQSCEICNYEIEHPSFYQFVDVSQVNSRNFGQMHWDSLQWIMESRDKVEPIRPINCVKTYGGMNSSWGSGSNQDGVERFARQMLLGVAAGRHHRSDYGNGNNDKALASLRAIRTIEKTVKFWDLKPAMEILDERLENEAYAARNGDQDYLIYFPSEGSVTVTLALSSELYQFTWISISSGEEQEFDMSQNSPKVSLSSLSKTGGFYLISER